MVDDQPSNFDNNSRLSDILRISAGHVEAGNITNLALPHFRPSVRTNPRFGCQVERVSLVLTQIPTPGQPRMNNQNQRRSSSCFSSSPCADPASLPDSKNPEPIEFIRKTSYLLIRAFHAFSACGKQKKQIFEKHCLLGKSNPFIPS